jgi:hypothetical protein
MSKLINKATPDWKIARQVRRMYSREKDPKKRAIVRASLQKIANG